METQDNLCKKVSICIPSISRYEGLKSTLDSLLSQWTYPNYEVLIYESDTVPEKIDQFAHCRGVIDAEQTKQYLDELMQVNPNIKVTYGPWKPVYDLYESFFRGVESEYLILFEDDITTFSPPEQHVRDSIAVLDADPSMIGMQQAVELAVSFINDPGPFGDPRNCRFGELINKDGIPPHAKYTPSGGGKAKGAANAAIGTSLAMYRVADVLGLMDTFLELATHHRSAERGFRGAIRGAGLACGTLLNSWGWCGHTGLASYGRFSDTHLMNVRNFYNGVAELGLVGPRDINEFWGIREENRKKVKWSLP